MPPDGGNATPLLRQGGARISTEMCSLAHLAAHDLRAPLRNIGSLLGFLREDCGDEISDDVDRLIAGVDGQIARARALIDRLVLLADVSAHELHGERVILADLARDVVEGMADEVAASGAHVEISGLEEAVTCDAALVKRALRELLGNALKFRAPDRTPHISVTAPPSGGGLVVRDNGVGFDDRYAEKILAPFQRLDGATAIGPGLGLTICRTICDAHGWTVSATGAPGEGAAVTIRFGARAVSGAARRGDAQPQVW